MVVTAMPTSSGWWWCISGSSICREGERRREGRGELGAARGRGGGVWVGEAGNEEGGVADGEARRCCCRTLLRWGGGGGGVGEAGVLPPWIGLGERLPPLGGREWQRRRGGPRGKGTLLLYGRTSSTSSLRCPRSEAVEVELELWSEVIGNPNSFLDLILSPKEELPPSAPITLSSRSSSSSSSGARRGDAPPPFAERTESGGRRALKSMWSHWADSSFLRVERRCCDAIFSRASLSISCS